MRRLLRGISALALAAAGCAPQAPPPVRVDSLLVRDVRLVSPERSAPLPEAWVLVQGGRIAEVGEGVPPRLESIERVIEGRGRYLSPGLVDGHVHLLAVPGLSLEQAGERADLTAPYFEQLPRSYLYFGFTTLVDLNLLRPEVLEHFQSARPHPDVLHCGGAITVANGYPMSFLPEESRFELFRNFLWIESEKASIPERYRAEEHTPERAVERALGEGASCIKTFWEKGFGPRSSLPTPDESSVARLLASAHSAGVPLVMHANSLAAHQFAARAGADAVVHGLWNWGAGDEGTSTEPPSRVREALDREIEAGVAYMPSLQVIRGLAGTLDPALYADPRLGRVVPQALLDWYRTEEGQWFARELLEGQPATVVRQGMAGVAAQGERALRYYAERGGRVLFGSDTPSSPTPGNPPGLNGYWELRGMEAAGLAAAAVFRAATLETAEFFGLGDEVGSVEPGKKAHLLLLTENPLETTAAWDTIDQVIVAGRPYERDSLGSGAGGGSGDAWESPGQSPSYRSGQRLRSR